MVFEAAVIAGKLVWKAVGTDALLMVQASVAGIPKTVSTQLVEPCRKTNSAP